MENQLAVIALVVIALLIYGSMHGALNVWVWRNREHLIIPHLLFMSPVGVGGAILAAVPFIGWTAAITVIVALAVSFVPVMLIVGWAVLNRKDGGLR